MKKYILLFKIPIFIFFSIIICILSLYVYAFITPKFSLNTLNNITFYDNSENNIFENNINYSTIEEINDNVLKSIVSIEDKNFYSHKGFDVLRIIKALLVDIKNHSLSQGASTISQQYVKNLYLTFDKTWKRKIKEAYLTIELETHYSKDEILEGYLNTINFGSGCFGIKNASNYYFGKDPSQVSLAEAAILVGIPKNPTYYNPVNNYDNAKKRQYEVLKSMVNNGLITENEMKQAYNEELTLFAKNEHNENSNVYYYRDAVINELNDIDSISESYLQSNKIKIYTNLDLNVQNELENSIKQNISNSNMQVASLIIDVKTGKVVALIGGKDYTESQYNRVIYSKRQVGSTIKPFLYYSALENGFTASTSFVSEKTTFNLGDNIYSPKNANNIYANKNISMLLAIAYSDNVYAMKTHLYLGTNELKNIIKRVKINTSINENASSALGTDEINMLDYSNGFITLANEGVHNNPHIIEKITDENNNIIYEYSYKSEYLLNKKIVYILNDLLSSTYDYSLVNYTSPTMLSISGNITGKYAIKSGSTNTDYWTIGYDNNYLIMVWAGNDDNSFVKSSESKITKKIWSNTMNKINLNNSWYTIPNGITSSIIDPFSGNISSNGRLCYYLKGTEPLYYKKDETN